MGQKKFIRFFVIIALIVIPVVVALMFFNEENNLVDIKEGNILGEAKIGGSFTLIDQNGVNITEKDFAGRYMLVFFGFTNCPMICPTGLNTITGALELLKEDAEKIAPIFITVDPKRDTLAVMRNYISHFHPSFTAMTGSEQQIKDVMGKYRVYAKKIENEDFPRDYNINHTANVYLMDREGKYLRHFYSSNTAKELADGIKRLIE